MKVVIKDINFRTISNSGQCFRITEPYENTFFIISKDKFLRIKKLNNDTYDFDCSKSEFDSYYYNYFDLGFDYKIYKKICKDDDKFLKKCIEFSDGLRILRQDKFETIISFIISQRKSVKAIMTSIEKMSRLCGKKIITKYGLYYSFPSAKDIVKIGIDELSTCGLGYRTKYIYDFCKDYEKGCYDLDSLDSYNDTELIEKLLSIKGVGIKVASCIALFAYHRMAICPIDVWISRVLDSKYKGKIPDSYKKYAGMIQQYWFNFSRINKI